MAKTAFTGIANFIGQYDKKLIGQMLNSLDFVKQVRVIRNASLNGTALPKMVVEPGSRPLNLNVNQRGGPHRTFSGRKLMVYGGMKIISIVPEEAFNTFMSDMVEPGAKQIPFAQWIWEQEFAKLASELNDNAYLSEYHANAPLWSAGSVYTGGTDYVNYGPYEDIYKCVTTTTAGQSPDTHPAKWLKVSHLVIYDGWGTIIANEITAGNISGANLVTTGAITNTNALDKIELMYKSMTVAQRAKGGTVKLAPNNYRNYLEHERDVYGSQATPDLGMGVKYIYGDKKWTIEECSWMGTSGRIIMTQKDNLVYGTNVESDSTKVAKTVENLHGSDSVVKWLQGAEISDLETLYVNDQQ